VGPANTGGGCAVRSVAENTVAGTLTTFTFVENTASSWPRSDRVPHKTAAAWRISRLLKRSTMETRLAARGLRAGLLPVYTAFPSVITSEGWRQSKSTILQRLSATLRRWIISRFRSLKAPFTAS
jgi:hypothetical protein